MLSVPNIQEMHDELVVVLESEEALALRSHLEALRPADVAEVMELLEDPERSRVMFALESRKAAEVIALLDERVRDELVEDLAGDELARIVTELPADDAADVLGDLPRSESEALLDKLSADQSERIGALLEYDEATAGGLMTPDIICVDSVATVGEAIDVVRQGRIRDLDLYDIYAVGAEGHLVGTVSPQRLLLAPSNTSLDQIMNPDPLSVTVDEHQEQVLQLFRKYDLTCTPVVDDVGRIVGQITVDDVMDVAVEEADEDIYHMAGTDAAELETSSVLRAARIRLLWLLPSFLFMSCTAIVILVGEGYFEMSVYAALVAFVPMIGALAGCCSVQTSTIITRGLATGELASSKLRFVFAREWSIAAAMSVGCAVVAWGLVLVMMPMMQSLGELGLGVSPRLVARAVGLGMAVAIVLASSLGILTPFFFRRLGIDPAIAAGPLVTAANDVLSVSTYLFLSYSLISS